MTTEVAVLEKIEDYPVLTSNITDITEAIQENLDDEFDPYVLEQIKVPAGGATVWEREDMDPVKELKGIIIGKLRTRAYWKTSMDESGGGSPPDCTSTNSKTGVMVKEDGETEIRQCALCPLSRFGSDGKRGQACKQTELLFFLLPGEILPAVLTVPPTSLKESLKFRRKMTSAGRPYWSVVVSIGLKKDKNRDGTVYARLQFSKPVAYLDGDAKKGIRAYREAFQPVIEAFHNRNASFVMDEASL